MNSKKHVVSVASFADSIVCGTMFAVPSNETPPMVRAVWRAVAVPALPLTLPVAEPMLGVTRTGESENTSLFVPVSSEMTPASWADVVAANWLSGLATRASPLPVPALIAVRKADADRAETLLSALIRGKVIAPGSASTKKASPTVVLPRPVPRMAACVVWAMNV